MFKKIRSAVGKLFSERNQMKIVLILSSIFWNLRKYFLGVQIIYEKEFTDNWKRINNFSSQDKERNYALYQLVKKHNTLFTQNKNIIEFGVGRGASLRTICNFVNSKTNVYGLDQFGKESGFIKTVISKYDDHYIGSEYFSAESRFKNFDHKILESEINKEFEHKEIKLKLIACVFPNKFEENYLETLEKLKYSFVSLDFDLYESTLAALKFALPRLETGGIIFIDDYNFVNQSGVKQAVKDSKMNLSKCFQNSSGQLIYFN
jgi:hypothetical protein